MILLISKYYFNVTKDLDATKVERVCDWQIVVEVTKRFE